MTLRSTGGPGRAFYLNGDEIPSAEALLAEIRALAPLSRSDAPFRRLFIDEITAVNGWQTAIKRAIDAGELRGVLVVNHQKACARSGSPRRSCLGVAR